MSEAAVYGDALTVPFWEAAAQRRLVIQRCRACGARQHYPRPFCLRCESAAVEWSEVSGRGIVYSMTTVHLAVLPELPPPFVVAIVELDEGVRMTTNVVGGPVAIGDRVRLRWRDREGLPPLSVFEPDRGAA